MNFKLQTKFLIISTRPYPRNMAKFSYTYHWATVDSSVPSIPSSPVALSSNPKHIRHAFSILFVFFIWSVILFVSLICQWIVKNSDNWKPNLSKIFKSRYTNHCSIIYSAIFIFKPPTPICYSIDAYDMMNVTTTEFSDNAVK